MFILLKQIGKDYFICFSLLNKTVITYHIFSIRTEIKFSFNNDEKVFSTFLFDTHFILKIILFFRLISKQKLKESFMC
jgi:hypothetical protein